MLQAILIGLIVFIGKVRLFYRNSNVWKAACTGCSGGNCTRGYTNRRYDRIPTGTYIYGDAGDRSFYSARYDRRFCPWHSICDYDGKRYGDRNYDRYAGGNLVSVCCQSVLWRHYADHAKAADRFAEEGKYKKIEGVFLSNGFLFDLTFAVIAFGAFLFGGDSVTAVVNAIPGWLTTGIGIAAGILPALGFAQLINMIMNKKVAVFFLLGFLLSAYMGISTVGIVCFSVVIVGILLIVKDFVPNQPALQGGMDDDNEF